MSDSNKLIDSFFKKLAMPSSEDEDYGDIYEEGGLNHKEFLEKVMEKKREYCELCIKDVVDYVQTTIDDWHSEAKDCMNKPSHYDIGCYNPMSPYTLNKIDGIITRFNNEFNDAVLDLKKEYKEIGEDE